MTDYSFIGPSRARPIFISSTFKDMQAERDYLRSHVFPRLEEELRRRGHELEPIDLRLGVETFELETEEAREALVLRVCLAEIQRSRPFFLVILGDRYGWVPPQGRIRNAAEEVGYKTSFEGKSVTALEIEFGLLKEYQDQPCRSFLYFREPLPYDAMPPDVAALYSDAYSSDPAVREGYKLLQSLKASLSADPELGPRTHTYTAGWDKDSGRVTGLQPWGQMVFQHLWGELDEETRVLTSQTHLTLEDKERTLLMEFVGLRSRDFTGRTALLDQLHGIATGDVTDDKNWGACVKGPPGSGKSAIFAELWKRLANDPVLLLANAAGGTPSGSQPDAMLRRFIQELASFLEITNPLQQNAGSDDADLIFTSLLARASAHKRTVVLLDALDQFDPTPRGRYLTWLRPERWPANARLIATSLHSTAAVRLSQCVGIKQLEIPPLTDEEIAEIARRVFARYHRQSNVSVIRIFGDKLLPDTTSAASIPLWLTLALEQLNLLDGDDFVSAERRFPGTPAERLRDLVMDTAQRMPATVQELYDWLLAYTEKAYGAPHARAFAILVAVSRFGWREADLLQLVPRVARLLFAGRSLPEFDELGLASLRRGFRAHIVRRGTFDQIDFFHTQMRQTVRRRAFEDLEVEKRIHSVIAEYLESLPPEDPLRQTEQMVHLIGADDALKAAHVYADLPDPSTALTAATAALARHIQMGASQQQNSNLLWTAALVTHPGLSDQQIGALARRFIFDLTSVFGETADLPLRKALLEGGLRAFEHLVASDLDVISWQRNLSASQIKLGEVLLAEGRSIEALELYRRSLSITERLAETDSSDIECQRDLSVSLQKVADVLREQGNRTEALKVYEESLSIARHASEAHPDDGDWQRDLSVSQIKVGDVLREQGHLASAFQAYQESRALRQRLVEADPTNLEWQHDLAVSTSCVGDVLWEQGDLGGALHAYREVLAVFASLVEADPSNLGWQRGLSVGQQSVGKVLLDLGDLKGALEMHQGALAVSQRLATADRTNARWQHDLSVNQESVGDVLRDSGDLDGAIKAYEASLSYRRRLVAIDPANATWQHDLGVSLGRFGDVLRDNGNLEGAINVHRESLSLSQRLKELDPSNAVWQRALSVDYNKVGTILLAQGDLPSALGAYRTSLELRELLVAADPTNAVWQHDLAVSKNNIGDVLRRLGNLHGALSAYRETLAFFESLTAANPANLVTQHDLSMSQNRVGDVLLEQGDLAGAVELHMKALITAQNAVRADPTNLGWQQRLSVSQNRVGDVLLEQGDLAGAIELHMEALTTAQNLIRADPTNLGWKHWLSVIQGSVGDVLRSKGDLEGALQAYRASLLSRRHLGGADPTNLDWKRDLGVSLDRMGDVLRELGDLHGALMAYRESLGITQGLAAINPTNLACQRDLWISCYQVAALCEKSGDAEASRWWRTAYDVLSSMTRQGWSLSPQEEISLQQLRAKLGRA